MGTYTVTDIRTDAYYAGGLDRTIENAEAVPGSTVNFAVTGTLNVGFYQAILITHNITIDGNGQQITLDGDSDSALFWVKPGVTATIENLTIINGSGSGGNSDGGAIDNQGTLVLINDTFTNNSAKNGNAAGAVNNEAGASLTLISDTFTGNSASVGNAGGAINNEPGGTLTVTGSTFKNNTATAYGGYRPSSSLNGTDAAGAILNQGVASIQGSYFANDTAVAEAGHYASPGGGGGGGGGGSAAGGVLNEGGALSIGNLTFGAGLSGTGEPGGPGGGFYGGGSGGAGGAVGQPGKPGSGGPGGTKGGAGGAPGQAGMESSGGGGGGGGGLGYADVGGSFTMTCFRRGTRISTPSGEIAVEDLRVGDHVRTRANIAQPVRWIGYRGIDCVRHPDARLVWPVRVRAGAFDDNIPCRDLWLSPDHAVYVQNVLIPIRLLINDSTIEQIPMNAVTYFHIELPRHEVLLAEGLPAESYLDTGDRSKFANGGSPIMLHPDFSARTWEAMGCAPLIVTGPSLAAARQRVNARADALIRRVA